MSESRVTGSCLCGAISFSIELPTLFCGHCHCTMCQRNHGAAYVTWLGIARDRLTVDRGEARVYASSEHGTRAFCDACGTSLFCESKKHPDQVDIPLANMHGPIDRSPQAHMHFDDRADWTDVRDELPRMGGKTGMEPLEDSDSS